MGHDDNNDVYNNLTERKNRQTNEVSYLGLFK